MPPSPLPWLQNLARIEEEEGDVESAVEHLAKAADLDHSDVSLWYQLSTFAQRTGRLRLARFALESGLRVQPTHLPCLWALPDVVSRRERRFGVAVASPTRTTACTN